MVLRDTQPTHFPSYISSSCANASYSTFALSHGLRPNARYPGPDWQSYHRHRSQVSYSPSTAPTRIPTNLHTQLRRRLPHRKAAVCTRRDCLPRLPELCARTRGDGRDRKGHGGGARAEQAAVPPARPGIVARDQGCRRGVYASRGEAGRPEYVAVPVLPLLKFFFLTFVLNSSQ